MKNSCILSLLFLLLFFSCRGQQQNKIKEATTKAKRQFNIEGFNTQKDQIEINRYKFFYNDMQLGVDSLRHIKEMIGKPTNVGAEIVIPNRPLWMTGYISQMKDNKGNHLYLYRGKSVVYEVVKNASPDQYEEIYQRENDGTLKALVYQYSILFRPFVPRFKADLRDSLLMKIPALNGAVLVNGFPVTKDTPLDSLVKNLPREGGWFGNRVGIPTLVYDATTGHDFKDFDPRVKVKSVHINFLYMSDHEIEKEVLERITYSIEIGL